MEDVVIVLKENFETIKEVLEDTGFKGKYRIFEEDESVYVIHIIFESSQDLFQLEQDFQQRKIINKIT